MHHVFCCHRQVLENCSRVLEYFVSDSTSIKSRCLMARDRLLDRLAERYRQAIYDQLLARGQSASFRLPV